MKYSEDRKAHLLSRMLPPNNVPVTELSRAEGVPAPTLYAWRRQAIDEQQGLAGEGRHGKRGKRQQRADQTRRALFDAAGKIVGRYGYEGASVARITAAAGVANGTFYNYFETRQELFDQLLPAIGEELLQCIRERLPANLSGLAREERRLRAYFEFCHDNPGFLRILNEAEVYAPRAFKKHMDRFAESFLKALQKHYDEGELSGIERDELETVVYILLGARSYLTMMWRSNVRKGKKKERDALENKLIGTYVSLVGNGLFSK